MSSKYKVLIVEDDNLLRECLKDSLELNGYLVIEAVNGFEADKYLKHTKPDYLLLDLVMPEKNGFEMIKELRSTDINIIAMSGNAAYLTMAVELGAHSVLLKPFDLESLNKLIR